MKNIVLFAACIALTGKLYAQPWMQNLPADGNYTFYDIQKSFNTYWEGKDYKQKGKGWKAFKRWEWFWEQRVAPLGKFPNPMHLYQEYEKIRSARGMSNAQATGWTEMGPYTSAGGYEGLGRVNCVRVDPIDPNIIWAGAAAGGLWKSTDAGGTWSTTTDELPSIGITDVRIDPSNTNILYIATGDGDANDTYSVGVLKSTDGGATWNTTGLNWQTFSRRSISRLLMHPADPATLFVGGNGIHKTTDGGTTWTQTSVVGTRDMEFKPGNPTIMYASGPSGEFYRSTNSGNSWTRVTSGFPNSADRISIGVSPANPEYVYALASHPSNAGFYGLYRSTDSGITWSTRSNSPNLLGWEPDGSDIGGQGWYDLALAVSPSNAEEVYTGGVNNWKSTDGGLSWHIISMWYNTGSVAEVHADQHDLYFVPGTNVLYNACDGGVYRTADGGSTWTWLGNGLKITQFYRLSVSQTNPDVLIAGSQENGTKDILSSGIWNDVLGGDGMEALIDYTDANIMYGELYYGDIYKSVNGGLSFFSTTNGINESGGWITPYVIHPTDHNTLFAGFNSVWKSTNAGSSWARTSIGSGEINVLAIAPSDPNILYLSRGLSLSKTTNGGASWTTIPTPAGAGTITSIAIHQGDPNQLWATASGYSAGFKVWKSIDGGATWTNVTDNLPNVPANTIVYQNNSAERVYVGTDIGVYYRDLTTSDWVDFNAGLPNVIIDELEIQYSARKLRAATFGRGVWQADLAADQGIVIGPSPGVLSFGRREVGSPGDTLSLTIGSYGSDSLVISGIATSRPEYTILNPPAFPLTLGPLETYALCVLFQPIGHGDVKDTLVVLSNALNGPTTSIPLSGKGIVIGRAEGGVLFASSSTPTSRLYSVNTATGSATSIGQLGVNELSSLSIHPATKELYGIFSNAAGSMLYRVSSGYGDALSVRSVPAPNLRAIAFAGGDTLYGGTSNGKLYHISVHTGDTVLVGLASGIVYSGLSFNPLTGELWASVRPPLANRDKIYKVNTATGAVSLIGGTGDNAATPSIAFSPEGTLYGLKGISTQPNTLIRIDTATATGTTIGPTGGSGLLALAMRTDSIVTSVGDRTGGEIPDAFVLHQNYPNPFNPVTNIQFSIVNRQLTILKVYDVLGREVATLVNERLAPGSYERVFNARGLSSGVYLYRLSAGDFTQTRKLILMK